jgi:hypothetical protein
MNREQRIDWWADMLSEQMAQHGIPATAEQCRALAVDACDCDSVARDYFTGGEVAGPARRAPEPSPVRVPRAGACAVWCGTDFTRRGFVIDINERDQVALVTFPDYPSVPNSWERFDRIS